jgi:hypothetical protein
MISVERLTYGLLDSAMLTVFDKHSAPGHNLKHRPVAARCHQNGNRNEDMPHSRDSGSHMVRRIPVVAVEQD